MLLSLPLDALTIVVECMSWQERACVRTLSREAQVTLDVEVLSVSYLSNHRVSLCNTPQVLVWLPSHIDQLGEFSRMTRDYYPAPRRIPTFVFWAKLPHRGVFQGAVQACT
jgi:hypothetical protein